MVQRAEWRRLSDDPRSPLAWWCRDVRRTVAIVLAVALATILLFVLAWETGYVALAMLCAPPAGSLATYLALRQAKNRTLPRLAALSPSPAPAEGFPIEFSILQREVCTGRDQGIASFVDGWIHVEGLRTSFSLRPIDITGVKPLKDQDAFDLPGGQRVALRSLGRTQEDRDTFRETLRVWYRFPFGLPSGEPLLPPLAVHPSAAVKPLNTLLVHALFAVPTVLFFLFFGRWEATRQVLPFLVAGTILAYRSALKAYNDLRRLKNLHRDALIESHGVKALQESAFDRL